MTAPRATAPEPRPSGRGFALVRPTDPVPGVRPRGGDQDPQPLAMITMRAALRKAADEGTLLGRLADAREPFWIAVADALVVVADDLAPAEA